MSKRRFNDDEVMDILKEHRSGIRVADLCREHGISEPTFYRWQSLQLRNAGFDVKKLKAQNAGFDVKKLKALEEENQKLKKLLAEAMLAAATLSEMLANTSSRGNA
ncbi:transposase [Phyllobacterium sp. LjRoot231]|uniref:transposase n=1 Tax=Phyllobacterium sp. LjRoot231 TaxID=3342289 RepID=UPI003ECCB1C0